jgi:hypothetical protein
VARQGLAAPAPYCSRMRSRYLPWLVVMWVSGALALGVGWVFSLGHQDRHCWVYDSSDEPEYFDWTRPGCGHQKPLQ